MYQVNAAAWIGTSQISEGCLTPAMSQMLQATVTQSSDPAPEIGQTMPHLWHWAAFNETVPLADLALDGHPKLGGFLPPIGLDRRMWAGGTLKFIQPLNVGDLLTRHSKITNVVEKHGSAGPMVFVTVAHDIKGPDGLAVQETQDIVYLQIPDTFSPPKPVPAPSEPELAQTYPVTETLLFRYSALTFNAHRIHYDLPYATQVEKYPGLIVHGPMQATLLMDMATRAKGCAPDSFKFRGIHPMFHFEDLRLIGTSIQGGLSLCTASPQGHQGLQATALWEEGTP
ncbi:FAS1-like dehydratase domain-containing protein [Algirhabdus cladophorae]|uniref:FAS1-like dehydratase domain-containing protein n=1 Tax=Algirhabdus cladophorae TaxID=3377108 RepID=UPI003B849254